MDTKTKNSCVLLIGALLAAPLAYLVKGFVLTRLWGWFIVERFGLPSLTLLEAIGVGIVISYLTHQTQNAGDERDIYERIGAVLGETLVGPFIALLIGYIIHSMMG